MSSLVLSRWMLFLALATGLAHAEKADSDKPMQIDAQRGQYNDLKQTGWYEGSVVLVKGTLRIEGARLDFRKDAEGYDYATIVGEKSAGALAHFRQRRDSTRPGVDEYVEGQAERIEYDSKAETLKLSGKALWRRLENGQVRDEIRGNQVLYDSRNATYEAQGDGQDMLGRVRTVIAPRQSPNTVATPATTLKPASELKK